MLVYTEDAGLGQRVRQHHQRKGIDVSGRDPFFRQLRTSGVMLGVLANIMVNKSPIPDGIYLRILSKAKEEIAVAITVIFASSLITENVAEDRGIAKVPSLKKGNRDKLGNYRPVNSDRKTKKILRDRVYLHLVKTWAY